MSPLLVYLLASFLAAYVIDAIMIYVAYFQPLLVARMFTVALAALLACRVEDLSARTCLESIGLRWSGAKWILYGGLLGLAPYVALLVLTPQAPTGPLAKLAEYLHLNTIVFALLFLLVGFAAGVTVNTLVALGEEVGWRGYLHTRLVTRLPRLPAYLVTGVIWGLWHAPLIAVLGYNFEGVGGLDKLLVFTVFTVTVSLVAGWVRDASGSVLPPAALHGTINGVGGLWLLLYGARRGDIVAPPAGLAVSLAFLVEWLVIVAVERLIRLEGASRKAA